MEELGYCDALLLVDVQNDFCDGGTLEVPGGSEVVSVVNKWISMAEQKRVAIFASRDWHPPNHISFRGHGGATPPRAPRPRIAHRPRASPSAPDPHPGTPPAPHHCCSPRTRRSTRCSSCNCGRN